MSANVEIIDNSRAAKEQMRRNIEKTLEQWGIHGQRRANSASHEERG